ncbi:aminotransferase class I/II-fold pyridoxal phosphate-dependent enzyme [Sphingopyxis sp.]|jgi:glycine hydroxymethyltransferase|uniref:serine hydroxymethyltransferase n=1 Tax=Sphingopyxis sp. TaxID=1908224 RepID=UPI0025D0CF6A|nr:aminotransferase class I/II-fold pyridoxal phosphate-dependent enzyme [Sphingopyxis sp.]MBK6413448.1 aminotransferase class I/II-fold pyridoxal phosphate-dependent enzyme [Sphingopyxis sp.]
MTMLARRSWVGDESEDLVQRIASAVAASSTDEVDRRLFELVEENRQIHDVGAINLNPATNVMNPRAEALLSSGLGGRPSLGYPGAKYEMGLEAIEQIETLAAEVAAEVFGARFVEFRLASGAMANLYAFMATCKPGDAIIAPPDTIGGHVTHHSAGAAGLYGLEVHNAPVDADNFTVDVAALAELAQRVRPKLITIGGSLNLWHHPVREIRAIADDVGAYVLFDAAHLCGMIAGKAWQQPLEEGAHLMGCSTYKSLGGPPSGLLMTNDAELAERIDAIAYPGLTANFDVAKTASLALALLDWKKYGADYAEEMAATASALAHQLEDRGVPVFRTARGITGSHQFAVRADTYGGGQSAAKRLRRANILTSGIGLPIDPVPGDFNGLRMGTPEIVRWGMTVDDMPDLAELLVDALTLDDVSAVAGRVAVFRKRFQMLHFIRN